MKIYTHSEDDSDPFIIGTNEIHIVAPPARLKAVRFAIDTARKFAERLGVIDSGIADFEAAGAPDDLTVGEVREFQRAVGALDDEPVAETAA